ncbi:MAG: DNA internalization-related competence protein ComEC/Rec2 [Burkholderiales bacterium]|nr:DNA internalization-related competence protein ComEC/Rec2 [Burkholderiales bacterium]
MRVAILAFAASALLVARLPALAGWPAIAAAACAAALAGTVAQRRQGAPRLAGVAAAAALAGFAWASAYGQLRVADRLAHDLEGRDLVVTGVVAGLPQPFERGVRFELDVETARLAGGGAVRVPRRVILSWFNGYTREEFDEVLPLRAGERWRFAVRLKRPHGNANPHGFDFEGWLAERGIGATGYVRPKGPRERLDALVPAPGYLVERAREDVRRRFTAALPDGRYTGVLVALAVGDQRAIVSQDWDVFTRTGVGHLMSISGLHVTMVSGLFAAIAGFLWRRSERLVLALPARKAAAVAAVVAALAYTLLAGFQVPAQRTLYMLAVVALALWFDRLDSSSRVLAAALAVVLVLDPLAVTAPGFWLSFGAVAAILYVAAGLAAKPHWLAAAARTQGAVTLGLAPLAVALFQQVSLVSPVANAIAIPVVSFVVTPLALAAVVFPLDAILAAAHGVLEALMWVLDRLAAAPGAVWQQHAPAAWAVVLALAGVAWMLAPRGFPSRWVGALLFLPLAIAPPPLPHGVAEVTVLDVGQGLATVVRTAGHTLVYDTGPRYSLEADAGNRVVVPYLRAVGAGSVDALVVTHEDIDHAGGAASVMRVFPAARLYASLDPRSPLLAGDARYRLPCIAGQRWRWDGVAFEMLHPGSAAGPTRRGANDASCVLAVSTAGGRVLLTGDIEAAAEQALLAAQPRSLAADVVVVPHHGSRTSSTPAFVAAVAPRYAVVPVGYRNRFGHPKAEVLDRYAESGAVVLRTDRDGAVLFRLGPEGIAAARQRDAGRRYWSDWAPGPLGGAAGPRE